MESLKGIISDIRVFLYGGILTLPLTLAGTLLILGLFTANYAILFFLLGFLILVPAIAAVLNLVLSSVFVGSSFNPFKTKTSDICRLIIPYATLNNPVGAAEETVISSTWMAMIAFFIGYIFTNALELFNRESTDISINVQTDSGSDIETKVSSRKTQAIVAMASIVVFLCIIIGFRFYTGCESTLGLILTIVIFLFVGHGWYKALSSVGQDRLSDLFGIANRLLPTGAIQNGPIACVPQEL